MCHLHEKQYPSYLQKWREIVSSTVDHSIFFLFSSAKNIKPKQSNLFTSIKEENKECNIWIYVYVFNLEVV